MERSRYEVTLFQTIHTGIDTDIAIYKVEAARGRRFWRKFQPWVSKYSKQSRQVQQGKYNKQSRYLKYRRASAKKQEWCEKAIFQGSPQELDDWWRMPSMRWKQITDIAAAVKFGLLDKFVIEDVFLLSKIDNQKCAGSYQIFSKKRLLSHGSII